MRIKNLIPADQMFFLYLSEAKDKQNKQCYEIKKLRLVCWAIVDGGTAGLNDEIIGMINVKNPFQKEKSTYQNLLPIPPGPGVYAHEKDVGIMMRDLKTKYKIVSVIED